MRHTPRFYLLLLLLSSLLVDVSLSIKLPPQTSRIFSKVPSWFRSLPKLKRWFSDAWHKLKSFFTHHRAAVGKAFQGLSDLQQLLSFLGYLDSQNFTNVFNETLESAIKNYQINYNLNVTGQPDNETLQHISHPRCALPDVVNGSTTMNSGKNLTFDLPVVTPWWLEGKAGLTYSFWSENNVTDNNIKVVFQEAFNLWSVVTKLNFTEAPSYDEADIGIAFLLFDGKFGLVAGAAANYSSNTGNLLLDFEEHWVFPGENETGDGDMDLMSVVLHQIGHLLGLGHSSVEESVMFPAILPGRKKKTELATDDVERIQKLYPPKANHSELSPAPASAPAPAPPPPPPPPPPPKIESAPAESTETPRATGSSGRVAVVGLRWGMITTSFVAFGFMVLLD